MRGLGLRQCCKERPSSAGGKGGLRHEAGDCSHFKDRLVLSSGSLLTKVPLAPWLLTSSSFHLLGSAPLPASVQQLRLQYPKVISPVAEISDKLIRLLGLVLLDSDAGLSL